MKTLQHECRRHGTQLFEFIEPGTYEQAFCGDSFRCPVVEHGHQCQNTTLIPSEALKAQWESMKPSQPVLFLEGR